MPDAQGNLTPSDPGYIAPGTGLINTSPSGTSVAPGATPVVGYTPSTATAQQAGSTTYDPKAYAVTSDQTVQGQLKDIIAADSPLMQQAAVRANQEANSKGLLNSSIAVGSGQNAVIGQALPIASQDASTYYDANKNTINAKNQALQFGAAATNTAALANANLGSSANLANAQMSNEAKALAAKTASDQMMARLDATTRLSLGQLDSTTRMSLATLDAQNRELLQANASAANMFQETVKNIAGIAVDPTLSKAAKYAATQTQMNLLNEGLKTAAGISSTLPAEVKDLNLDQYFQQGDIAVPFVKPAATPVAQTPIPTTQPTR